jgi:hypothetical protein
MARNTETRISKEQFLREHDEQSDWPSAEAAGRYLGVTACMVHIWRRRGCSFLENFRPRSRRVEIEGQPPMYCYSKADIEKIKAAKDALPVKPQPGQWITSEQAQAITGYSEGTLREAINRGHCLLGGRRIATRKEHVVRSSGEAYPVTLLLRSDVEELARNRAASAIPKGRVMVKDAAKSLGISREQVRLWMATGCPYLNGRTMQVETGLLVVRGRTCTQVKLLSTTEVEEIKQRMLRETEQSYTDRQGTWLAVPLAVRRYPNARRTLLYLHRNKPCAQLGGDVLHAIQVRRTLRNKLRERAIWMYLEADLRRLEPPRLGTGPRWGKWPAKPAAIAAPEAPVPVSVEDVAPTRAKRSRGRPTGSIDPEVKDRNEQIVRDFQAKMYPSIAALAKAYHLDRSRVSHILAEAGVKPCG